MAIIVTRSIPADEKREMTVEELKRISKEALAHAIRAKGGWFAKLKTKRGIKSADPNGNGYVDANEIHNLVGFRTEAFGRQDHSLAFHFAHSPLTFSISKLLSISFPFSFSH
ncbi:conserved hypothetical protein [Ricinus communis]|uniref:EF-hand domain-containing protein n=1 Tax=Ricinus communis TaxID=3988 RepID=B9R7E3_RICCO|nr:conserved hypothetical protein [Ricinus communis]